MIPRRAQNTRRIRSQSEDILYYSSLVPFFSLFKTHRRLFSPVYEAFHFMIDELESTVLGNGPELKEFIDSLKDALYHSKETLFPAAHLYGLISKPHWNKAVETELKQWKRKLACSVSLCRLHESVVRTKHPKLQEKAKELTPELTKHFSKAEKNGKCLTEYKKLMEALTFEQYCLLFYSNSAKITHSICTVCERPVSTVRIKNHALNCSESRRLTEIIKESDATFLKINCSVASYLKTLIKKNQHKQNVPKPIKERTEGISSNLREILNPNPKKEIKKTLTKRNNEGFQGYTDLALSPLIDRPLRKSAAKSLLEEEHKDEFVKKSKALEKLKAAARKAFAVDLLAEDSEEALSRIKKECGGISVDQEDKTMIVLNKNFELALNEKIKMVAKFKELKKLLDADHSLLVCKEEALSLRFRSMTPKNRRSGVALARVNKGTSHEDDKESEEVPDELDQDRYTVRSPIETRRFANRFQQADYLEGQVMQTCPNETGYASKWMKKAKAPLHKFSSQFTIEVSPVGGKRESAFK